MHKPKFFLSNQSTDGQENATFEGKNTNPHALIPKPDYDSIWLNGVIGRTLWRTLIRTSITKLRRKDQIPKNMTSFCIDCIVLRSTKINKSMTRHELWNSVFSPKVVPNQGCDRYKDLDLQTRYRTRLGWFFWFCPIQRYDTTKGIWQIL